MVGSVASATPSTSGTAPTPGTPDARTVAEAMITRPHRHPADLTVAEARAVLEDPHVHLLLLVEGDHLVGTVAREDLHDAPGAAPARTVARWEGRTIAPQELVGVVRAAMEASGDRRLAVVEADGRLSGLLCLKRSGTGFCTDAGVAARAAAPRD